MERDLLLLVSIGLVTGVAMMFTFAFAPFWFHLALPASTGNDFQLDARFVYAQKGSNPCLKRPCYLPPTHYLVMRYEKPVFILGYSICDTDRTGLASGARACFLIHQEDGVGVGAVGDYPAFSWKYLGIKKGFEIGDIVNIRVNAAPLKIIYESGTERWTYESAEASWYDLGNSKVLEVLSSSDFIGRQQLLFTK